MQSKDYNKNWSPKSLEPIRKLFRFFDRTFDWMYGSKYNPLYQSGSIAGGLLLVVIITGIYLLFFYRLGAPYESMQQIQAQKLFGRWIRSFHRYASDATIIAIFFHFFRMLLDGKTWGPRTLAWLSGVIMLGILLFSAWTGFVMVWDAHALYLSVVGAKIADLFPFFSAPMVGIFSGSVPMSSSFFFMNLFLHIALPLGMIVAFWLHTSRLSRSKWFPEKKLYYIIIGLLFLLSVVVPSPLGEKADLLSIRKPIFIDWFYSALIYLDWHSGTKIVFTGIIILVFLMVLVPFFIKPNKKLTPSISIHDEEKCEGCRQCMYDCPFEAIEMVPRKLGIGSEYVANVSPNLCVSCGLCSGSCSQFAIGPLGRSGRDQLSNFKSFSENIKTNENAIVIIFCKSNPSEKIILNHLMTSGVSKIIPYPIECVGSLHPGGLTTLLNHFKAVFILSCPPHLCQSREGVDLAIDRIFNNREPGLPNRIDKSKIKLVSGTHYEMTSILKEFYEFAEKNNVQVARKTNPKTENIYQKKVISIIFTTVFLGFIAMMSSFRIGQEMYSSAIRLSWRLPGQVFEKCKTLSADEIEKTPIHMRKEKTCERIALAYELSIKIDGNDWIKKQYIPKGAKRDNPLYVDEYFDVESGNHNISIQFSPIERLEEHEKNQIKAIVFSDQLNVNIHKNRILLVTLDSTQSALKVVQ